MRTPTQPMRLLFRGEHFAAPEKACLSFVDQSGQDATSSIFASSPKDPMIRYRTLPRCPIHPIIKFDTTRAINDSAAAAALNLSPAFVVMLADQQNSSRLISRP